MERDMKNAVFALLSILLPLLGSCSTTQHVTRIAGLKTPTPTDPNAIEAKRTDL